MFGKKSRVPDKPRRRGVERGNKSNFPLPASSLTISRRGARNREARRWTGMHDLRQSDVSLLEGLTRVRHLPNFITGVPELSLPPPVLVARINLTVIWKCGAPGWAVREDPVGHEEGRTRNVDAANWGWIRSTSPYDWFTDYQPWLHSPVRGVSLSTPSLFGSGRSLFF